MAGLQIIRFDLSERRIEPSETARFNLEVKNTYLEVSITNVKITVTFPPLSNITVSSITGDSPSRIIYPFSEGKYTIEIKTDNTPPSDYQMDIKFDYDVVISSNFPKFSQDSKTITVSTD